MKKIIAFAGTNSKTSINKQLVTYSASLLNEVDVTILDLNDSNFLPYGRSMLEGARKEFQKLMLMEQRC